MKVTWSRAMCMIGSHDWARWKTVRKATTAVLYTHGERKCRRCGKVEIGAAPKQRKPRRPFADTVTFTQVMPPKDEK